MYIKLKHLAALALVLSMNSTAATAQTQAQWGDAALKRYALLTTPGQMPTSHALAYKGQVRLDLGLQQYIKSGIKPDPNYDTYQWFNPHFLTTKLEYSMDASVGLSFSPSNRLTLGAAALFSNRTFSCPAQSYNAKATFDDWFCGMDLSATYHNWFGGRFAYEVRYNFGFSHMDSKVEAFKTQWNVGGRHEHIAALLIEAAAAAERKLASSEGDDHIGGWALRHGIMGGVSAFNDSRSLQGTLMLQADYVRFKKREYGYLQHDDYSPVLMQYDINKRFVGDRGHAQLTPALLFAYHAKYVFSAQFHVGLPISVLDGKIYAPCPTWGIQLSFRLKKWHRTPPDTSKLIHKVVEKVLETVEPLVTVILDDDGEPQKRNDDDDDTL